MWHTTNTAAGGLAMNMSGGDVALILTALGTLISSLGSVAVSLRNSRKIDAVHDSTNGKMDALLKLTAKSSKAEGTAEEKAKHVSIDP
jgi:hypothetical protein